LTSDKTGRAAFSSDLREESLELRVSNTVTANVSRDLPRQGRP
jgi:hypothetical protein